MKKIEINTTQNVPIAFELASVSKRLGAFVIDNILKIAYLWFLFYMSGLSSDEDPFKGDGWSEKAISILVTLPIYFYTLFFEILFNGQTIGKMLLKIRVITIDGFKPSKVDFIIRWFLRVVDFNLWCLILVYYGSLDFSSNMTKIVVIFFTVAFGKMIGYISVVRTKNSQRIGDLIANTIVVSLTDTASFSQTISENIKETYKPTYPKVICLSDNDVRVIKDNYTGAIEKNNMDTLAALRKKIIEVTEIEMKHNNDKTFIQTILKDYNYYTQDM